MTDKKFNKENFTKLEEKLSEFISNQLLQNNNFKAELGGIVRKLAAYDLEKIREGNKKTLYLYSPESNGLMLPGSEPCYVDLERGVAIKDHESYFLENYMRNNIAVSTMDVRESRLGSRETPFKTFEDAAWPYPVDGDINPVEDI